MAATRQGKNFTWQLSDTPIGSGDAGEVYAVTCLDQPDLEGVMKIPAHIATGGTIQRQAGQIAQEARALAQLNGIPQGKAHPPRLLDQSPDFTQSTANYFIVSETAIGDDLASMLVESRKTGKPFPRRVIITILDALFDLFARAHRVGILWNDVKLDHIYWHNPTKRITVIDWGNALFLNHQAETHRPVTPRWEDYQQMVETLGDFLQRNAPELFADLGWDEFQGRELDSAQVSVLARRIAYQQQVVSLKEMENQSLIRVVLNQEPSISGLQKITTYHQTLEELGAPCPHEDIVDFAQSLVLSNLTINDIQTSVQATALIWNIFNDDLDLPWYLVRAYFRDTNLLTHSRLASLVKSTFLQDYPAVLWSLAEIERGADEPSWWDQLVPVLRQKALDSAIPSPYQLGNSVREFVQTHPSQNTPLPVMLDNLISSWRTKGEDLRENPFEYDLLDVIHQVEGLPNQTMMELKQSFALGEKAIRRLFQAWVDMNWDEMRQAFRQVISWDPDRWGIFDLESMVTAFISWLESLHTGPQYKTNAARFLKQTIETRPTIEQVLGRPPWFSSILTMLNAVSTGEPTAHFRDDILIWAPWLANYDRIFQEQDHTSMIDKSAIDTFLRHLKTWSDVETGLQTIGQKAPSIYPECTSHLFAFENSMSINQNPDESSFRAVAPSHSALQEALQVMEILHEWRNFLKAQDLASAKQILTDHPSMDWQILKAALKETEHWQECILPNLVTIQSFSSQPEKQVSASTPETLDSVTHSVSDLQNAWCRVYQSGVHEEVLAQMEQSIEQAHKGFLLWRQSMEHSQNRISQVVYHSYLGLVREITDQLLRLWQHVQQTNFRFKMLEKAREMKVKIQMSTIENILDHLAGIEEILIADENERRFPLWQQTIQKVRATSDPDQRRQIVLTTPEDHPMYTFLIQSQFGFDD